MKRFLALSRTTHGILDLATPAFFALLWAGHFPSWQIIVLGSVTAFAGYTAIYALNDLVGVRVDQEKYAAGGINAGYSVEASDLRYPLARGLLPWRSGLAWFLAWYVAALVGSWFLNPVIVIIVLAAAGFEVLYCRLFKVTYLRTLVSGLVKASGPIAAVFAVNAHPLPSLLLLQLAWLMLWEIGGQNIPADWNDVEEDRRVHARTVPLVFGPRKAGLIVVISLALAVCASLLVPLLYPISLGWVYLPASLVAGYFLLLQPGLTLYRTGESRQAARLFDRASFYPLVQLCVMGIIILVADLPRWFHGT